MELCERQRSIEKFNVSGNPVAVREFRKSFMQIDHISLRIQIIPI